MLYGTQLLVPSGSPTFTITNGTGAVSDIQAIDSNFILVSASTSTLTVRTSMNDPSVSLARGSGLQSVSVQVQRNVSGGNGVPTVTVRVLQQGSSTVLATPINAVSMGVIDEPQVFAGTWNASVLSSLSGLTVEYEVVITTNGGGGNARSGNLGYIGWNAAIQNQYNFKSFETSEWSPGLLKIWNGSGWSVPSSRIWNGTDWIDFRQE
jgi:hypothetical protein